MSPAILGMLPGICCPHPGAESVPHFAQRRTIPILIGISLMVSENSLMVRCHGAHAASLHLCHAFSTDILVKLLQFQCGWLLDCPQRCPQRWLIQSGRSGFHLLALGFLNSAQTPLLCIYLYSSLSACANYSTDSQNRNEAFKW